MSTIDIRNADETPVTRIRFADDSYASACFVTKLPTGKIVLEDEEQDTCTYNVKSEDLPALLKALEKATQLGWI